MHSDADAAIARGLAGIPAAQAERALEALHVAAEREYRAERARWLDAFTMHAGKVIPEAEPQQVASRAAALFETVGYLDPLRAAADSSVLKSLFFL